MQVAFWISTQIRPIFLFKLFAGLLFTFETLCMCINSLNKYSLCNTSIPKLKN